MDVQVAKNSDKANPANEATTNHAASDSSTYSHATTTPGWKERKRESIPEQQKTLKNRSSNNNNKPTNTPTSPRNAQLPQINLPHSSNDHEPLHTALRTLHSTTTTYLRKSNAN